jgi:hypothetical protein
VRGQWLSRLGRDSRTGTEFSPLCNRCIFLRGVAYHNRREPNLYPVGAHWMLPDAPYALGMRVFKRLRRISPTFGIQSPINKIHLFAT